MIVALCDYFVALCSCFVVLCNYSSGGIAARLSGTSGAEAAPKRRGGTFPLPAALSPRASPSPSPLCRGTGEGWLGDNKLETIRRGAHTRAQHEHAFSFKARDIAESRRRARKTIS